MPFTRRRSLVLVTVALGVFAGEAQADCDSPPTTELLWSFPKDGDTAPRNTLLWLLFNERTSPASVTLDGVALDVGDAAFFGPARSVDLQQLGTLALGAHTVVITPPRGGATTTLTFEAIDETAGVPPEPTITGVEETGAPSGLCRQAIFASECFDTGQDVHFAVATSSRASVGQVLRAFTKENDRPVGGAVFWPAECGDATFFAGGRPLCFTVEDVGPTGVSRPSEAACFGDDIGDDEEGAEDGDAPVGCSSAAAPVSLALALLAFTRWRRTQQRTTFRS